MRRMCCCFAVLVIVFCNVQPPAIAKDEAARALKQQERYNVSLELEFRRKNQNGFQRVMDFLNQQGPNGFASGFVVGEGLVMTAYHVVSGELVDSKKRVLGFNTRDELDVRIYVNGCRANVIRVDKEADLALLEVCNSFKPNRTPLFQATLIKDERIVLIASPHGSRIVSRGIFDGPYSLRGLEYLSAKLEARDGYSGSPVYNQKAEVVGVFSGYDWAKKVALITPGMRAEKLLADYAAEPKK